MRDPWISLVLLSALAASPPACAQTPAPVQDAAQSLPATIVPGELVVRFAKGSALAERVAASPAPAGDEALAAEIARSLGSLGVPLAARSVTSGGELVLTIERERLREMLVERLTARAEIAAAEAEPERKRVRPASSFAVRVVELAKGTEAGALERATAEIAGETGWPLALAPGAETPRVVLDLSRLTLALLERLRARPDVEYAQPNQALSPY
jgi:hypothetical protein